MTQLGVLTSDLRLVSSGSTFVSTVGIEPTFKKSTNRIYSSLKDRQNPLIKLKTYAKRIILGRVWYPFFKIKGQIVNITDCVIHMDSVTATKLCC